MPVPVFFPFKPLIVGPNPWVAAAGFSFAPRKGGIFASFVADVP